MTYNKMCIYIYIYIYIYTHTHPCPQGGVPLAQTAAPQPAFLQAPPSCAPDPRRESRHSALAKRALSPTGT